MKKPHDLPKQKRTPYHREYQITKDRQPVPLLRGHLIFRKINISYHLVCTRASAYQGVNNVPFTKKFEYEQDE